MGDLNVRIGSLRLGNIIGIKWGSNC